MADNLLIIQKNIRADKQSTKKIRPSAKKIKKFVQSTVCMYIYVYIYISISLYLYIYGWLSGKNQFPVDKIKSKAWGK